MHYSKIIELCKEILNLGKEMLSLSEKKTVSRFETCMKLLLKKANETFESIIILTENNKIIDAGALVRILIENLCQVKYIRVKPEDRVEQFIAYDYIVNHQFRQHILKSDCSDSEKKEVINEMKMFGKYYDKFKNEFFKPGLGWHQKKILDLMKCVNLADKYPIYWLLNHNIHSGPTAVKKYMDNIDSYKVIYLEGSTDFYFMTLDEIDEIFDLKMSHNIDILYRQLYEIAEPHLQK